MPSTYEPQWPPKYSVKAITGLKKHGIDLDVEDLELFQQVCAAVDRMSAVIREEGPVIGGARNPVIGQMRDLEDESYRVFTEERGLVIPRVAWPGLSRLYAKVADGILEYA